MRWVSPWAKIAPPLHAALVWLLEKMQLVMSKNPLLQIAPPSALAKPLTSVRLSSVRVAPPFTTKIRELLLPLMVILPPPSIVRLPVIGGRAVPFKTMLGEAQLNVIV